ncbi:TonB-dependent receptor [Dysgonomonas sp. 520]|uniref:TonB-dependent receptor n=1 Tax=Dysgonomonas sp. 520 TaxID=2302931 RepID=UPI0013D3F1E4|nr:TonB-dependent receptor [Dysgonomonas sp. 520]NDW10037.1 TonB-dependent receptor [Dysgonomonas sp. 520]
MYKHKFLCFWFILIALYPASLLAQTFKVSGTVVDGKTKELLMGVPILVKEMDGTGTSTSADGQYSLWLEKGSHTLSISYVGYETKEIKVSVTKNMRQDVVLSQSSISLDEVVISTERPDANVSAPQTGVQKMTVQEVMKLPVLMGERDVLKALQLTPGVKAASEGGAGFFVRGGSSDQNLILLDNVSLYNASHLLGFFSTFNTDIVRDVTLYKGAMPAQYGERLASIVDVQQRSGDVNGYHASGGIGLISSNLTLEGPIQKGKSSFIIGGRRTYADAIARLSGVEEASNAYLYFYDLNAKANFALTDKDQLSFSGYWGKDKMVLKDFADTDWGNLVASLKWNHRMNYKWSSATTLSFNRYAYHANADIGIDVSVTADIKDFGFKQEFIYNRNPNNEWRFGLNSIYHRVAPGDQKAGTARLNLLPRYALENGAYVSNQWKLTDNLEIVYGLRMSAFMAMGKGEYYTLDSEKNVLDTTYYKGGKVVKTYINLEPRFSAAYKLNDLSSIKAAYARTTQNMHLLQHSAMGTPYDRWTMSSNNIKPQIADQYSLGYFRNFDNNTFEFSVEAYYKDMKNQLDFKDNAEFGDTDIVETELLSGKGRAYGIELMLKKRVGRLTGWIGYTLSKSEKKIDGINFDRWYSAHQDRTHDISIVGIYELTPKWTVSAAWVYYTGNALTYPSGKYQIDGKEVMYYAERNGYRAPAYHRLDLGAVHTLKKTKKFTSELAFSLYNAYGRENAYMINFRTNDDDPTKTSAYQYSLFRFIPSISWNFKF